MKKLNKKGFTLIELIVVIAILAVLALLLVPQITGYIQASKDSVGAANARTCYSNLMLKAAANEADLAGIKVEDIVGCDWVSDTDPTQGAKWTGNGKTYTYDP
ncbi:prepilin-type N-terminal cleavage/methylation domain-containing protein, partial [Anaerorhabdus sp.]|uniref:prepilin-type N-terminal cleavage/methylation domain-containing protein n=1 Tax=Anaerorhabdus sp. TaxID=1872524 RepID=UPI002FCA59A8